MNTAALLEIEPAPSEGGTAWSEALARRLDVEAQADRDCNTHEAVRYELKAALLRAGLRPSDSRVSDATLEGPDGFVRYEVLGADRSGYSQLRAGAARLIELDRVETTHRHPVPDPVRAAHGGRGSRRDPGGLRRTRRMANRVRLARPGRTNGPAPDGLTD